MKKCRKWFFGIMMAVMMIALCLPVTGRQARAAGSGVWIGKKELEDGVAFPGTVSGSVTWNESTKTLAFENFEGVGEIYEGNVKSLLYIDQKDVFITGKAKLAAEGENVSAICIEGASLTIEEGAELILSSASYTLYQYGNAELHVCGSLDVSTYAANSRDAIWVNSIGFEEGCNVNAFGSGEWCTVIHGDYILISGGHVTASSYKENCEAIQAKKIEITGGDIDASATGKNSCAIGGIYSNNISINGGHIRAEGGQYAIHAETGITRDPEVLFKEPADGAVSGDGRDIVDAADNILKSVILYHSNEYGVTVGKHPLNRYNRDNTDNVLGIQGGGSVSFDPETRTLTFEGDVTGVEGWYDHGTLTSLVSGDGDLTIEGSAALENELASTAVYVKGTDPVLTVNGDLKLKSAGNVLENSGGKILINGDVTAECAGEGNAVAADSLIVDGGKLTATGRGVNVGSDVISVATELKLNSGSIRAEYLPPTAHSNMVSAVLVYGPSGRVTMNGGSFTVINSNTKGGGIFASNTASNVIVNGGRLTIESSSDEIALRAIKNIELIGGEIHIDAPNGSGIRASEDVKIGSESKSTSAEVSIKSKGYGIRAGDEFQMDAGSLSIEATDEWAVIAQNKLEYKAEAVTLSKPAGGKIINASGFLTIADSADVPAKIVKLDGEITYPVWVGSTQITKTNMSDIPGIQGGGSASYDPVSKILAFTGDVTGVTGVHTEGYATTQLFSGDEVGLTIEGNAVLRNETAMCGLMANRLVINGNMDVLGLMVGAYADDLLVNGKLTAETTGTGTAEAVNVVGDVVVDGGEAGGLFAKGTSDTMPAIEVNGKLKLLSGVLEAENVGDAIQAKGGIEISASHGITLPEDGMLKDDGMMTTVAESDGITPAKQVRIEKLTKYDLWVGNKQVTSLNNGDIPGIQGGGKASYDPESNTLTFTGDVTGVAEVQPATKNAVVYSKVPLIIEGNADFTLGAIPDSCGIYAEGDLTVNGKLKADVQKYGIYTEGNLTVNGQIETTSGQYGVCANKKDILVNGENGKLKAAGEKAAISAKDLIVDGGQVDASVSGVLSSTNVIETIVNSEEMDPTGNIELKSGSITVNNAGNNQANGVSADGKVEITDGSFTIVKADKGGYGLRAGSGIYADGGKLAITCKDKGAHYTSNGIEESYLFVNGGEVDITMEGLASTAIANAMGNHIQICAGSLQVVSNLTPAIKCAKFTMQGGTAEVTAMGTAIDCIQLNMEAGRLTAKNTDTEGADGAIRSDMDIALPEAVSVAEPAGGRVSDDKRTFVTGEGTVAKQVKLAAPVKYPVWVGATQVTDMNQEDIPGVEGGKASYDPSTKTLTFTGEVTGVKDLNAQDGQIFAQDQDLTVCGKASLTKETAKYAVRVYNGNLAIDGDIDAAGSEYGIDVFNGNLTIGGDINATGGECALKADTVTVKGNVEARGGNTSVGAIDASASLILEGGKLTVTPKDSTVISAITTSNLLLNSGSLIVNATDSAALYYDMQVLVKGATVKITGKDGIDVVKLTMEGGSIDVQAKNKAINVWNTLTVTGGTLKATSETIAAVSAGTGITIGGERVITLPEGGKLSTDGKKIVNADDTDAKSVTIEKPGAKYTVQFNMQGHGTAPDPQTVTEGDKAILPSAPAAEGYIFLGWFKEAACENEYNFDDPVNANITLYAKWKDATLPSLAGIEITRAPNRTAYQKGEIFSAAGMVVTATYTAGDPKVATGYTWTPAGPLGVTDTVITVSYTEDGITKTAAQPITVTEEAPAPVEEEPEIWNLFTDKGNTFEISGLNAGTGIRNSNAKSDRYFDAKLNGKTITVALRDNVNRKTAASPSNAVLTFVLGDGSVATYVMPVQYVKPSLKLSSTSVTINKKEASEVKTRLLCKAAGGQYEPFDLSTATVKYGETPATGDNEGNISFVANAAANAKISVKEPGWEAPVELKFSVKTTDKDVLNVDLDGAKSVILNTTDPAHTYLYDVTLNGKALTPSDQVDVDCGKAAGIAAIDGSKLKVTLPVGVGAGSYTVTLTSGSAQTKVRVKVSSKALGEAISLKVQSKYDVVTKQPMVVVPQFKDAGMAIDGVVSETPDITAKLNDAGNIEISYTGTALNAKKLTMGDISLKLTLHDVTDPVVVTIKNAKAKKSTPTAKATTVIVDTSIPGEIKGSVNIISTCKDAAGVIHLLTPTAEIVNPSASKVLAEVNPADQTEIDIKGMDAKAKGGSVKVKLTYPGGVTKNVTITVKKK